MAGGHPFAFHDPDTAALAAVAAAVGARMEAIPDALAAILDRPDDAGAAGAGEGGGGAPAAPVEPGGEAGDAGAAGQPPAGAPPAADDQPDQSGRYSQSYVENLRREAQSLRERAKSYDEVFGAYDDNDRQVWLALARTFREDPEAAARWMVEQGQIILNPQTGRAEAAPGAGQAAPGQPPATAAEQEQGQLTAEKVAELINGALADRDRRAEQERVVAGIVDEAKQLGYDPDKEPARYITLLTLANQNGGDLTKAHEAMQAEEQRVIDAYVAAKAKEADTAAGGGGTEASHAEPIKGLGDARRAMEEWLDAQVGSS